jgi:hypothetical protein
VTGGLIGALVDMGVPEETAQYYAEGVRRGGHLVTIRTADHMTDRAVDILNRHNPTDVNERASQWRQEGWTGFDSDAETFHRTTGEHDRNTGLEETQHTSDYGTDIAIERAHDRDDRGTGGLEETHHTSDYGTDIAIERAHDRDDRGTGGLEETHHTSDYGTDIAMEGTEKRMQSDMSSDYTDFSAYDDRFRNHFDSSFTTTDYTYEQYQPAYRYGYDLATDERFVDRGWQDIEPEARSRWDERNPGTWEQFKSAVRHAYEEIKDAL